MDQSSSQFAQTRWSLILAAGQWPDGSAAEHAFNALAKQYWYPLYAYLRRKGSSPHQAEDLVQGFFTHLLEKDALQHVDQDKGKFRAFLLASLKNFHANVRDQQRTLKRGGAVQHFSLDTAGAEKRYNTMPMDTMTPDRLYDRQWALTVLDQVLQQLKHNYTQQQQAHLFDALEHLLVGGKKVGYAQIGLQLSMTESAVKVAAHRLRQRYRQLLRETITHTVENPALVDEEIKELLNCL